MKQEIKIPGKPILRTFPKKRKNQIYLFFEHILNANNLQMTFMATL